MQDIIYLNFVVGSFHGWGICGKYLTRELSALAEVKLLSQRFSEDVAIHNNHSQ